MSQRIKVIHIITRFDKGGSAENTYLTAKGLDEKRYAVMVVKGPSWESQMTESESGAVNKNLRELQNKNITVITMQELMRKIHLVYDILSLVKLTALFKRERPHIVHTHTSKAGILGRWAAFLAGVPVIIHTPHGHVFWGYFGRWKTRLFILMEKLTAFITDKLIMLTEREREDNYAVLIVPEKKFVTIHSGINLDRFTGVSTSSQVMKRKLNIPEGHTVIGTVGRLTPVKGPEILIRAAKEVIMANPLVSFVFLGDGELHADLEKMAVQLEIIKHIQFLGWRPDVAEVMSAFDIFVLPSLNEGMGRVLVEAMALGKPIVASRVGGIPDLVHHWENGFLVPVGDAGALAAGIQDLLVHPEMRAEMGAEGKKMSVDYGADAMVHEIDRLYRTVLAKKGLTED